MVAVSGNPARAAIRWAQADVLEPRAWALRSRAPRSSTTSCTRSAKATSKSGTPAARTVAREAERAGVRQLVYLGGLGDESSDLSAHLRSRHETARLLAAGGVAVTTLRAAVVIGRGSAAFETIVALVDRLPVMVAPRWVSTPTQPIALADVVAYLAGVAGREETFGETFDLGGPDVMTYREMIERVARLRGKRRRSSRCRSLAHGSRRTGFTSSRR